MDRDEIVRISRSVAGKSVTIDDISIVLMQYCIEQGKPYYETTLFVTKVLSSTQLAGYFMTALDYYERTIITDIFSNKYLSIFILARRV